MHYTVHGILQARTLEWVAFPFSRGSSQPRDQSHGLPHGGQILYQLSHKGSPRTLQWVADPFSSGSSWPRNQSGVSCIAGGFFTTWATREAQEHCSGYPISSPADHPDQELNLDLLHCRQILYKTELSGKPTFPYTFTQIHQLFFFFFFNIYTFGSP